VSVQILNQVQLKLGRRKTRNTTPHPERRECLSPHQLQYIFHITPLIIELISYFARELSLGIRLEADIFPKLLNLLEGRDFYITQPTYSFTLPSSSYASTEI
jgi:hypothetical protein